MRLAVYLAMSESLSMVCTMGCVHTRLRDGESHIKMGSPCAYACGIRHYGLLANGNRGECLALTRQLLSAAPTQAVTPSSDEQADGQSSAAPPTFVCRHCGHAMAILRSLMREQAIRAPPPS